MTKETKEDIIAVALIVLAVVTFGLIVAAGQIHARYWDKSTALLERTAKYVVNK